MSSSARPPARRGPSGAWNRLKPGPSDPLDVYGLPSKGELRLHEHKVQEAYYSKIVERYMKFCASSGNSEDLDAAFASLSVNHEGALTSISKEKTQDGRPTLPHRPSATSRPNDLPNILLAMRKLREGILGSHRRDQFAQRAYMFIIHASILTKSWESYQPALNYLLNQIHTYTPLSKTEYQEFSSYKILDLACRQNELLEAFTVRLKCRNRDRRVAAVLDALVHDDWVRFWRTKRAVDGYYRGIMEFAVVRMRLHALKCVGKGYLSADKGFIERSGDSVWEELVKSGVGWQLEDSGKVIIRKPKPK